ncbi:MULTISPECIES: DUF6391 domain-containing protein [unclassified Microcoleus]|uniref:DUF6391 domain-containing protein n=1 Tax=unclassified Microcoleus TaxID=2642155 RepID=UPI002FD3C4CE
MTTNAASSSWRASPFPFDFAPQRTQDADLLRQLNFVPGLKEVLTLRQVHALEHATVWVLSQSGGTATARADNDLLGGMSTDQGFYLYGRVNIAQLRQAVREALQRIASGEWDLAVHPRCGTNLSVGMLLTAGLAVGINLALPRGPILQLLGLGAAAAAAAQLAPDVGALAQRYVTTAIPFNLGVVDITLSHDFWGREAHFVRVRWVE